MCIFTTELQWIFRVCVCCIYVHTHKHMYIWAHLPVCVVYMFTYAFIWGCLHTCPCMCIYGNHRWALGIFTIDPHCLDSLSLYPEPTLSRAWLVSESPGSACVVPKCYGYTWLSCGCGDPNSGPHACVAGALPTQLSFQPHVFHF